MSAKTSARLAMSASLLALTLSGCFRPPYNNFNDDNRAVKQVATYGGVGAGIGAVVGSVTGNTAAGATIGGIAGVGRGIFKNTKNALLKELQDQDIQFIQYGDTLTLVVPTDKYFLFDSPHLKEICYPGLNNIIKLIKYYPNTPIFVAGFTDDVGTRHHKKMLSQAQAETMLTFLWANDIHAQRLHAEGYASQHTLGDNHQVHGSAYNRRIEIQWLNGPMSPEQTSPYISAMSSS